MDEVIEQIYEEQTKEEQEKLRKVREHYVGALLLADNIVNEFLGKRNLRKLIYNESAAATLVAAVFEKLATPRVYLEEKIEREARGL